MNKIVISIVVLALVAAVFATTGSVFAQSPTPGTPVPGSGNAFGNMNSRGSRGAGMGAGMAAGMGAGYAGSMAGTQSGLLHADMAAVYAEALGISVDDLNARLAQGETLSQIAAASGLSAEEFSALMAQARTQALDQAVQAGSLTQTQADWMKQRGAGIGAGRVGARGTGLGLNANPDCPYYPQTTP